MKQKWILPSLVVAGALLALWFFTGGDSDKKGPPQAPVEVIKAYKRSLFDNVEALGTAHANESIDITASATETISEINFTDGQLVKKGDVIARLEQREEQAALGVAKARLEEHKRELERIDSLLKNKAASRRDYDERQTLIKVAGQEIEGIEAQIADRTLRAPFDGILGIRRLSVGALVQPGDMITTLDDISSIKLDFTVPAIHLEALKPGTTIEAATDALKGHAFKGTIGSVDTRIDPVTRAVLVRAVLPNPENMLRPGLLMQVTILVDEREGIVVPEESVLQRQDEHAVLVVDPESLKVESRVITPGVRIPGIMEVREGLSEGELVIVRGVNRVQPGDTVTIKETWEETRPPQTERGNGE